MEISYLDVRTKEFLTNPSKVQRKYGSNVRKALAQRLDWIEDAHNQDNLIRDYPGKCKELTGRLKGHFSMRLDEKWRLIFIPNYESPPRKPDGGLDLQKIEKVKILEIDDYH